MEPIKTNKPLIKRPYFSLKRAAMLNWANLAVHTILSFVTTPMVLNGLGADGYGVWAVILSLSGYYGLANLGIGTALGRFVTRDIELGNLPSLQATIDAATIFFTGTSLLILGGVFLFGENISDWLRMSGHSSTVFQQVLLVAALGIFADFFSSISRSILAAAERLFISSILTLVQRLSQAAVTIAVILLKPGLLELTIAITCNTAFFQIITQIIARNSIAGLRSFPSGLHLDRMGELLRYGSGSILITVGNLLRLRLGNILIARYSTLVAVTNYNIATNLITNFSSVISSSTSVLGVRFNKLDAANDLPKLHQTYRISLFATSFIAFGLGSLMIIFSDRFIIAWLGREMPETVNILTILIVAYMLSLCQGPGWNMMFARNKHHSLAWVTLGESIANVVLGLFLSRKYGAVGFAWSTAITMSITKLTFQPWHAARIVDLPLRRFLEPMMFPALSCACLIGLAKSLGLEAWLRTGSILHFLLAAALFGTTYVILSVLPSLQKDYLPGFIGNPLRKLLSKKRATL